jgi:hypothetical protein
LSRKHLVDGVYRLDAGARLDAFGHFLPASGVLVGLAEAHGAASHRQMVPVVQDVLLYGVTTRFGRERIQALPSLLCRDAALMPWVGQGPAGSPGPRPAGGGEAAGGAAPRPDLPRHPGHP